MLLLLLPKVNEPTGDDVAGVSFSVLHRNVCVCLSLTRSVGVSSGSCWWVELIKIWECTIYVLNPNDILTGASGWWLE